MEIAIDLDGVLADIHSAAISRSELLEAYTPDNFSTEEWKEYKHWSYNVWHNNPEEIPLVEAQAPNIVSELKSNHTITILTHRVNVESQIQSWLSNQDIVVDEVVPTSEDKGTFDFDIYVDDNPIFSESAYVVLRSREWNRREIKGYDRRISSIKELPRVVADVSGK